MSEISKAGLSQVQSESEAGLEQTWQVPTRIQVEYPTFTRNLLASAKMKWEIVLFKIIVQ